MCKILILFFQFRSPRHPLLLFLWQEMKLLDIHPSQESLENSNLKSFVSNSYNVYKILLDWDDGKKSASVSVNQTDLFKMFYFSWEGQGRATSFQQPWYLCSNCFISTGNGRVDTGHKQNHLRSKMMYLTWWILPQYMNAGKGKFFIAAVWWWNVW